MILCDFLVSRFKIYFSCSMLLVLGIFHIETLFANETLSLPEPLSLEYALNLSRNINPDLAYILSAKDRILSEKSFVISDDGINFSLEGQLKWFERSSIVTTTKLEEHKISLLLNKPLYDFGKNKYKVDAANNLLDSNEFDYQADIYLRQIKIMEAFFNVLLADLFFHRNNENMSLSYISWDRSKQRNKIGQLSELEVARYFSEYQVVRKQRFESENDQRQTRNLLAILMFTNGELPTTLITPKISSRTNSYPKIELLTKKAFSNNLKLKSIHKKILSVKNVISSIRANKNPQIGFFSEYITYTSDVDFNNYSRENWNVGIKLNVPIYDSGKINSELASERTEIYRLQALLAQSKAKIQHELLSLKLKLDTLRFERDEANSFNEYSELNLEEKRALYELEVKTTLGTAMVQTSDAQYQLTKSNLDTLLTWAKIDLLLGEEPAVNLFR